MRFILWGLLALFLNACSVSQVPLTKESYKLAAKLQQHNSGLTSWDMTASTSISTTETSYSLIAFWQQTRDRFKIRFDAPFTTGVLRIKGDANYSELTLENKKTIHGATPEQLIAEVTRFEIPVTGLTQWIRGIPHSKSAYAIDINANGDTKSIKQDGWLVEYDDWQEVEVKSKIYRLPNHIDLKNNNLRIKISPSQWLKETPLKSNPLFSDLDS